MSRVLKTGVNQVKNPYGNGHNGIDIVKYKDQMDTIIAHSAGTVVMIQTGRVHNPNANEQSNESYGNFVKIQHANGYYTLYAHLASVAVALNAKVTKGQTIGVMGNTGRTTGPHLHFEVRNTSNAVINPTAYINADLPNLNTTEEIDMTKAEVEKLIKDLIQKDKDDIAKKACPTWASTAVQYCINQDLISGDSGTPTLNNVRAQSDITRAEMCVILHKMKAKKAT